MFFHTPGNFRALQPLGRQWKDTKELLDAIELITITDSLQGSQESTFIEFIKYYKRQS